MKSPLKKLKDKLWQLCRQISIIRYGDTCYCCGATNLEGSNRQLGHFIPSSICSMEMRYDLGNLRISCYRCNINLSGNWPAFEKHLILDNGKKYVEQLKQRNEQTKGKKYDSLWIEEKIREYTEILHREQL